MKDANCEVIQDLLPLYVDGCCSEGSRLVVEEHLMDCRECGQIYLEMSGELPMPAEPAQEPPEAKTAMTLTKGFKKILRRWLLSLVAAALAIPLCVLGWNQFRGCGVCFTNLHELWIANAFLSDLQRGDYEAAYQCVDIEAVRERWLKSWSFDEETLVNLETDGLEVFLSSAQDLIDAGGITEYHYLSARLQSSHSVLDYVVVIDGEEYRILLDVSDGGVQALGGIDACTAFGQLSMWNEYLWQHYKGCYFDWETKQYVYYDEQLPDLH